MTSDIQTIKNAVLPILRASGVMKSSLFGSVAEGKTTNSSDIDILIRFRGRKTFFDLLDLKEKLEKRLGKPVDVLTYNAIHPLLRDIIKKQEISILDE